MLQEDLGRRNETMKIKPMIFSSPSFEGKTKAEWMASLPIGAKVVTRRKIEQQDVYCSERIGTQERQFFPKKYAKGTLVSLKRADGVDMGKISSNPDGIGITIKPVLYKITFGMWHKEWVERVEFDKLVPIDYAQLLSPTMVEENLERILKKEAKLEGFESWNDLIRYFKENEDKTKTGKLEDWRIEMERIQ